MKVRHPFSAASLLAVSLVAGGQAQAAPITVVNPSFEDEPLSNGGFRVTAPPGWWGTVHNLPGYGGYMRPAGAFFPTPSDGLQIGWLVDTGGLGQDLAAHVEAGEYVLTADFAYRTDCCGTPAFTMQLGSYSGGTLGNYIGDAAAGYDDIAFKTATLDIVIPEGDARIGSALYILFQVKSDQVGVDNVTLDFTPASPVPLPAGAFLLAPALAGLSRCVRSRPRHA